MSLPINNEKENLRRQFLASLPQRLRQIEDLWHKLRHLSWSEQGAKTFHRMVDRLVSLSSSFDLPEISSSAEILARYLQEHLQLERPLGGIECEMIEQMTVNLARSLNSKAQPTAMATLARKPETAKRVFLVDDDHAFAAIASAYLRASGFQVQQFDTAEKCMLQVFTEQPHVILLNVGFQGDHLDSLKAIAYMKNQFGLVVPLILLSARTDMQARLRSLRAGCTDYLTKPVNFSYLVERVSSAISNHAVQHQVMIINHNETEIKHYAETLQNANLKVIQCTNPLQSLQYAIEFTPDLVIIDTQTEEISGIEIASLLHQEDQFCVLPILLMAQDKLRLIEDTFANSGINDILSKPVAPDLLVLACERAISNSLALKKRIARMAQHAANPIDRRYFFSAIDSEIKQQSSRKYPTALYYIGLDLLPQLQEDCGQTGLESLHQQYCQFIAQIIDSEEQWTDIANLRVCVLTGQHLHEHHQQRAAQIIAHLNSLTYELEGKKISLNATLGISYLHAEIDSADSALWSCQQAYNKVASHSHAAPPAPGIPLLTEKYDALEFDFQNGLPSKNLALSFQPIVNPQNPIIENHEVLVRWNTSDNITIPAANFLQYIEQSFMRIELDRWVLQAAVTALGNSNDTREYATLFIHLSEDTLAQKSFFSFTANVLHSSRLRGEQRLIFMLKEQWVANHLAETAEIIAALNNIHCGACLSRAGETRATEKILMRFNFNFLTLSPHLTANFAGSADIGQQLKQINAAADQKKTRVIATQLEDSKTIPDLSALGINLFQGYFIQIPKQQFQMRRDRELANKISSKETQGEDRV